MLYVLVSHVLLFFDLVIVVVLSPNIIMSLSGIIFISEIF